MDGDGDGDVAVNAGVAVHGDGSSGVDGRHAVMLSFQKLDVYKCAIEFLALAAQVSVDVPRGNAPILDQLKRAATSIPLNIAKCAAVLDALLFSPSSIRRPISGAASCWKGLSRC
jgi:23S rRNA-intervening sequence protein